jgi:hypothetical protein
MTDSRVDRTDLDRIINDMAVLKNDIGRLIEQMRVDATQTVNGEFHHFYDTLASEGENAVSNLTKHVEKRPLSSLLIAFATGYFGGRFLSR